jgi:cellulose synthase (UDP-forming)
VIFWPRQIKHRLQHHWQHHWQQHWQQGQQGAETRLNQGLQALTHWLTQTLPNSFDIGLALLGRWQHLTLFVALLLLGLPLITLRPTVLQQGLVALGLLGIGQLILRLEERQSHAAGKQSRPSEYLHLLLVMLSGLTTLRYLYYRTSYTLNADTPLDFVFSLLLYLAELYAILTLFLSYFQTLKIRDRQSVPLSTQPMAQWPTVDVYIPTYNEAVEIVRKTALAALALDYPAHKKRVYILDDGRAPKYRARRDDLRALCQELGCTLLTRDNNDHAKAGNINTALTKTDGDLVLILDCDHIPIRSFLQETIGFFFDEKVSLVQTPHWFYNPDPFERNLLTQGQIPVGNELFYKILQKGNDYWNAAFFCGSAAVIRRNCLLEVGGIATETVTEDCHTSLRLHALGYRTIYYDKIMVAGLAPEKFSAYVGQQVRWARGMAQILRIENPLLNRRLNLRWAQRLCYFSATSHFFFGFPRLMYAVAPNLFLLFGINPVKGLGLETLFYALPHIVLSMHTNHIPYKHVRFSFWNEIYEFAMSFQAGIVTLLALVSPGLGKFNVTDKGLSIEERRFDLDSVRYLVVLGAITAASLLAVPIWLVLSPLDTQAVLINALWCGFNLVLVVAACLVAFEQPQLRQGHRLPRHLAVNLHSDGGIPLVAQTINISETGALVVLDDWPNICDRIRLEVIGDHDARVLLDAKVVRATANDRLQTLLALEFTDLSPIQQDDLTLVLYSDVRQWYSQHRLEQDNPIRSLRFILTSLKRAFQDARPDVGVKLRKQVQTAVEVYWEGWPEKGYTAHLIEIGSQDLRLELLWEQPQHLDYLAQHRPILSLLIYLDLTDRFPKSLLAQVERVEYGAASQPNSITPVRLELSFPKALEKQQRNKIRQLIQTLQ